MIWSVFYNSCFTRSLASRTQRSCQQHTALGFRWRRNASFASNSAIKHLLWKNSTIQELYALPKDDKKLREFGNANLLKLVEAQNFGAAEQLCFQLIQDGVRIEPHTAYGTAAAWALQSIDNPHRLEYFEFWLSITPQRNLMERPLQVLLETDADPFPDARRVLFASPSTYFPVILRFALICAKKGYLQPMLKDTFPLLLRFASVEVGTGWLGEMEQAIAHLASECHQTAAVNHFRDLSVRVCSRAGWLSYAMSILQSNPRLRLTPITRSLLIEALRNDGRIEDLSTVVRRSNTVQTSTQPVFTPNTNGRLLRSQNQISSSNHSYPERVVTPRVVLAAELRTLNSMLRNRIAFGDFNVADFLSRLEDSGASQRIVEWLRRRAFRAGPHCRVPWLKEELVYYYNRRRYEEVLKLYLVHFSPDPRLPGLFPDVLARFAERYYNMTAALPFKKCLPLKRWMVLKAIVRLTPTLSDPVATLQALYESYRSERSSHDEAYVILSAFMSTFNKCGSPDDAVRVFKWTGNIPYASQVKTLAEVLASAGRVDKTMALLRRIESGEMETLTYDGQITHAQPSPLMFIRVIEGFVKRGLLKPALEVEAMMRGHLKADYVQGKRHVEVIRALRTLQTQGSST
ncbi:hypothetical protein H0H92_002722 [Tricholoma furcatifolium]|nr:hypothetical protein H0H92_002722 [Tricholoma furcatifolium]